MMMQMLHAGGMLVLSDQEREADEDNPRGYLEFEAVKRMAKDREWLGQAVGKVVKIVAQLLPHLDEKYENKIIFMQRDLDEVLASQRKMLDRQQRSGATISDEQLGRVFSQQLKRIEQWLADRQIPTLYVEHRDTIQQPRAIAQRVNEFLGRELDEAAMAVSVDPNLYHQRSDTV